MKKKHYNTHVNCDPGLYYRDTTKKCEKMTLAVEKLYKEANNLDFAVTVTMDTEDARGSDQAHKAAHVHVDAANSLWKSGFRTIAEQVKSQGLYIARLAFSVDWDDTSVVDLGYRF